MKKNIIGLEALFTIVILIGFVVTSCNKSNNDTDTEEQPTNIKSSILGNWQCINKTEKTSRSKTSDINVKYICFEEDNNYHSTLSVLRNGKWYYSEKEFKIITIANGTFKVNIKINNDELFMEGENDKNSFNYTFKKSNDDYWEKAYKYHYYDEPILLFDVDPSYITNKEKHLFVKEGEYKENEDTKLYYLEYKYDFFDSDMTVKYYFPNKFSSRIESISVIYPYIDFNTSLYVIQQLEERYGFHRDLPEYVSNELGIKISVGSTGAKHGVISYSPILLVDGN